MKNIKYLSVAAMMVIGLYGCGNAGNEEAVTEEVATEEKSEATEETTATAEATYSIDATNSTINWKGSMIGVYFHTGTINITDGSITTANGAVTGGSLTIDATSIATDDDDKLYAMAPRDKFEGHLKSNDFLGVVDNPSGSFTITGVDGNTVTGDLTLKGKTNSESMTDVSVTEADGKVTITGALTFDRQKYGISYEQAGDMVVSDDIELTISVSGSAN